MNKEMWEILVPKCDNEGKEFSISYHKWWDDYIKNISGGMTIMRSAKGIWVNDDKVYEERMIPVRVICYEEDINRILAYTKVYYSQIAVCAYKISDKVLIYS